MSKRAALAGLGLLGILAAGCGSGAVSYVTAGDPVLSACQASSITGITGLKSAVDSANASGVNGTDGAYAMTQGDVTGLKSASASYLTLASQVEAGHPAFADTLRNESVEFATAAAAPNGYTTNSVAVATDKFARDLQATCASFQVGTKPGYTKPGPGIWDWGLFWIALGGYLAMMVIAGRLIAVAQRSKPRRKRFSPGQIFWLSTVWWVTIFTAIGGIYRHSLASATLTRDEKKDDRLAALAKENARLEAQQVKQIAELDRLQGKDTQ